MRKPGSPHLPLPHDRPYTADSLSWHMPVGGYEAIVDAQRSMDPEVSDWFLRAVGESVLRGIHPVALVICDRCQGILPTSWEASAALREPEGYLSLPLTGQSTVRVRICEHDTLDDIAAPFRTHGLDQVLPFLQEGTTPGALPI